MYNDTLQDNIHQFLKGCHALGLNDAQLFDTTDLQEPKRSHITGYTISILCTYLHAFCCVCVFPSLMSDG